MNKHIVCVFRHKACDNLPDGFVTGYEYGDGDWGVRMGVDTGLIVTGSQMIMDRRSARMLAKRINQYLDATK